LGWQSKIAAKKHNPRAWCANLFLKQLRHYRRNDKTKGKQNRLNIFVLFSPKVASLLKVPKTHFSCESSLSCLFAVEQLLANTRRRTKLTVITLGVWGGYGKMIVVRVHVGVKQTFV